MYSYPTRNEIAIVEDLSFLQQGFYMKPNSSTIAYYNDYTPYMAIERNLYDDTFNFVVRANTYTEDNTFISIDNSTDFEVVGEAYNIAYKQYVDNHQNNGVFDVTLHHSLFGSPKLNDSDLLVFGSSIRNGDFWINENAMTRNIVSPRFQASPKSEVGTYDDAFKVSTVETISFSENKVVKDHPTLQAGLEEDPTMLMNNIYFLPRPIDVENHTRTIMDVFIENESGNDIEWDHNLNEGKLTTSSLGSESLTTSFVYTPDSEDEYIKQGNGVKSIKKYGEIRIDDHTYYDYDSKKTEVGLSSTSKLGELIPYNYSGDHIRNLEIEINESMGKVNLQWIDKITSPLLDEFNGLYRMNVDNNYEPTISTLKHLPAHSVTSLRERLKDDEDAFASLSWFERQSNA